MALFYKTSRLWVIDFTYDGRPRRWIKPLRDNEDGPAVLAAELLDLYGSRARVVGIRPATHDEETQYIHGDLPKNVLCPTGRRGSP
ncbi:MAG: hypothetical protein Q8R01_13125 [Ramlibacter sp.]|nr:hypothetical protein [Ramlibacter sp.]